MPGYKTAEEYYQKLASGDPTTIQRALAPAAEQISAQADAAKENIKDTMPRGGESRLAQENTEVAKASGVGRLATTAYTSTFPALASIGGTGIGLSTNEVANAIASFGGASQSNTNMMNVDAASKAATMGFAGSLAGAAAQGASAGMA